MVEKEIINEAIEMTKDIPGRDVLAPLIPEEKELAPYPKTEYKVIEATTMDKLVRDVNNHMNNGWVCDGGVQVVSGPVTKFYQSLERWNVDADVEELMTKQEISEEINYGIREEDYPRKTEEEIEQEELAEEN